MFIFKRKACRGFCVVELSSMATVYQLKIKYDQDKFGVVFLDAKHPVSFPLEDKHFVNEHTWYEKVMTPCKKNVLVWCTPGYHMIGLKQTCGMKNVTLKAAKKIGGCRSLLGRVICSREFFEDMTIYDLPLKACHCNKFVMEYVVVDLNKPLLNPSLYKTCC